MVPKVGIGVIVLHKGQILMGQRKASHGQGQWATPGGHLEWGETVEECAFRELMEETGLEALSCLPGPWVNNVMEEKHYVTLFVFVDQFKGEPQLLEPDKCNGWQWFPWDSLPEPLFPSLVSLIKKEGSLIGFLKGTGSLHLRPDPS